MAVCCAKSGAVTGKSAAGRARHPTTSSPGHGPDVAAQAAAANGVTERFGSMVRAGLVWPATAAR
jgi:hypothetical protein